MEADVVAESQQRAELIQTADGMALLVRSADVDDETAIRRHLREHEGCKLRQPFNVLILISVAVFLLALESKGRAGDDEVDAVVFQPG